MIFTVIINAILIFLSGVISLLPFTIPAMPSVIMSGLSFITDNLASVASLLRYIYTPVFFTALVVVAVGLIFFDSIYGVIYWVLRKIPFIDIH